MVSQTQCFLPFRQAQVISSLLNSQQHNAQESQSVIWVTGEDVFP